MSYCYEAALAANTTTVLYVCLGLLIGFLLSELTSFVVSRWMIRRDRKRIDKLMADTKGELDKYHTDRDY